MNVSIADTTSIIFAISNESGRNIIKRIGPDKKNDHESADIPIETANSPILSTKSGRNIPFLNQE